MNNDSNNESKPNQQIARARVVGVFAKYWTPGNVKTRLAATIGDERAATFHREAVVTTLARLIQINALHILAVTPREHVDSFRCDTMPDWQIEAQCDGDLGERMTDFFAQLLPQSPFGVVLMGSDSPDLPMSLVDDAFDRLQRVRLVLGPSDDGGYYLIGARGDVPPVLDDMPFGTPSLFEATLARLDGLGWKPGTDFDTLAPWYDIDDYDDLVRLKRQLAGSRDLEPALVSLQKTIEQLGIDA